MATVPRAHRKQIGFSKFKLVESRASRVTRDGGGCGRTRGFLPGVARLSVPEWLGGPSRGESRSSYRHSDDGRERAKVRLEFSRPACRESGVDLAQ